MSDLDRLLAALWERRPDWAPARGIVLELGGRRQRIRVTIARGDVLIWSVVRRGPFSNSETRELSRLAWKRNAAIDLVSFGFDRQDRLIGEIRHPQKWLDVEELELMIRALAEEFDRFEEALILADLE